MDGNVEIYFDAPRRAANIYFQLALPCAIWEVS